MLLHEGYHMYTEKMQVLVSGLLWSYSSLLPPHECCKLIKGVDDNEQIAAEQIYN